MVRDNIGSDKYKEPDLKETAKHLQCALSYAQTWRVSTPYGNVYAAIVESEIRIALELLALPITPGSVSVPA